MPRNPNKTDYSQGFPGGFEVFASINDPRDGGHTLHHFGEILFIAFAGVLCGVRSYELMEELSGGKPWPQGLDLMGYIHHTKKLLREKLSSSHLVDSFTIQKDPQTIFCMFFFTPHIRGFEKMLEAKWKFNKETGMGWHYSSGHSAHDLFSESCAQTLILERELERLLAEGRSLTNAEIYRGTLAQGFLPKRRSHNSDF